MEKFGKYLVLVIGLLFVLRGLSLLLIGAFGQSSPALNVTVRRQGGERAETVPNRYTWVMSYDFKTRDGILVSGFTQNVGSSHSSGQALRNISYLTAFPFINAPSEQTGMSVASLLHIGMGGLILWCTTRTGNTQKKRRSTGKRRKTKKPLHRRKPAKALNTAVAPLDANEWIAQYRRNARNYAYLFFFGVVLFIGTVIRLSLGEWNMEWIYATSFASGITWLLAYYSRKSAASSWTAKVTHKHTRVIRNSGNMGATTFQVTFTTSPGKKYVVRCSSELFDYYQEGIMYHKVSGLNFPIPTETYEAALSPCPLCGQLLTGPEIHKQCPACHAPRITIDRLGSF